HSGNMSAATLTLTGAGFTSTSTVSLVAGNGNAYAASTVRFDSPTQLRATFAAGAVPAGVYAVRVTQNQNASYDLPSVFTVVQGGQAQLKTNLVVPNSLGYHALTTLYVEYSNVGDV